MALLAGAVNALILWKKLIVLVCMPKALSEKGESDQLSCVATINYLTVGALIDSDASGIIGRWRVGGQPRGSSPAIPQSGVKPPQSRGGGLNG